MIKRTFTLTDDHAAYLANQDNASETVRAALDAYIAHAHPATLADVRADIAQLRAELHTLAVATPSGDGTEDEQLSHALEALGL